MGSAQVVVDEHEVRARRVLGLEVGDLRAGGGLSQAAGTGRPGLKEARGRRRCPGRVCGVVLKGLPGGRAAMEEVGGVEGGWAPRGGGEGATGWGRGGGRAPGVWGTVWGGRGVVVGAMGVGRPGAGLGPRVGVAGQQGWAGAGVDV